MSLYCPQYSNHQLVSYQQYFDIDEQAARLTGYDQRYQQLSSGRFKGAFLTCKLDEDLSLFFEYANVGLFQTGLVPSNCYAIAMVMNSEESLLFNSENLTEGSVFFLPPNSNMEVISQSEMDVCLIHIEEELLNRGQYDPLYQEDDSARQAIFISDLESNRMLYSIINDFIRSLQTGQFNLDSFPQRRAFKNLLVSAVEYYCINDNVYERTHSTPRDASVRRCLFHNACEFINENLDGCSSVQLLANQLYTSRRTLEYVFRDNANMSPARYIKLLKFNEIRREILLPENSKKAIGDIVAKWGVCHLSHFATDYYNLFGELPSQSRKSSCALIN